jgi:hypothetical protein
MESGSYPICSLPHSREPEVPCPAGLQHIRFYPASIIADQQPKLTRSICQFHVDVIRPCVAERVGHCLPANPVDFVL